ncbi:hypothetical protein RRG08_032338 [Elysia crispata]|uniref:Uncharacterized protein n=1 Tax=Elysia crispata TaxID=231223 RepID=A0AAE1DRC5_9GAST|nr:hypothetical protein RRG08_032338 [Elysia crispata]
MLRTKPCKTHQRATTSIPFPGRLGSAACLSFGPPGLVTAQLIELSPAAMQVCGVDRAVSEWGKPSNLPGYRPNFKLLPFCAVRALWTEVVIHDLPAFIYPRVGDGGVRTLATGLASRWKFSPIGVLVMVELGPWQRDLSNGSRLSLEVFTNRRVGDGGVRTLATGLASSSKLPTLDQRRPTAQSCCPDSREAEVRILRGHLSVPSAAAYKILTKAERVGEEGKGS